MSPPLSIFHGVPFTATVVDAGGRSKSEYCRRASRRERPMCAESEAVNSTKCGYKPINCSQETWLTVKAKEIDTKEKDDVSI